MVGYWDSDLVCRYANAQYLVWFGKSAEQMLGITIQELMGPELFARNKPYIDGALAGQEQEFERLLVKADGSHGWTQARYVPDIGGGRVRGFFVLVTEITQLKLAEARIKALNEILEQRYLDTSQALVAADQSYQEIFSHAPAAIVVRDITSGAIVDINPLASEITGYSRDELLSATAASLDAGDSAFPVELVGQYMNRAIAGEAQRFEWPIRSKSGKIRWLDIMMVRATIGGKPRLVSFYQQIDERKALQQRQAQLNAELEERVDDRTRDLKAAIKELEAFTYTVSHDLRAPLRAISGFSKILQADFAPALPEQAQHFLGMIESNARRMGLLIDDLLAFSSLGQKSLVLADVDLAELVRQTILEIDRTTSHHAEFKVTVAGTVRADYSLLVQVMTNLLSNAVKYSARNPKPVVQINSAEDGDSIVCSVADNGVGFKMQYAEKLFGVFERLHSDTEFEGVGVGLAIVKRIVERHGGRVWAEAEEGKGAKFFFSLPKGANGN